jgi:hypothetical protein
LEFGFPARVAASFSNELFLVVDTRLLYLRMSQYAASAALISGASVLSSKSARDAMLSHVSIQRPQFFSREKGEQQIGKVVGCQRDINAPEGFFQPARRYFSSLAVCQGKVLPPYRQVLKTSQYVFLA